MLPNNFSQGDANSGKRDTINLQSLKTEEVLNKLQGSNHQVTIGKKRVSADVAKNSRIS